MNDIQMPTHFTEVSYLWENCCSGKCYEKLLEQVLKQLKYGITKE